MLKNIKVLDLTIYLAGPYCSWILAALGADVIKIERPGSGDPARSLGPFVNGESIYFASVNRNKRSLVLDLKSTKGLKILEHLISEADILVENLRPGVRQSIGLCDERLHQINPRLITLSISGFGATSPHADHPAFDIIAQAMSGMMYMTGESGGPPNLTGASIGDIAAGMFGAINVLSRLHARDNSNIAFPPRAIDMSMTDCQMALLENAMARSQNSEAPVGPIGTRHASSAPFQLFNAADHPFVIAVASDPTWVQLCRMLSNQGFYADDLLNDPRFQSIASRNDHVAALSETLEAIFITRLRDEWLGILQIADIPAAPVNNIAEAAASSHATARNLLETVTSDRGTKLNLIALPFGQDQQPPRAAPSLGQHSSDVLMGAGYSAEQISNFKSEGIIN